MRRQKRALPKRIHIGETVNREFFMRIAGGKHENGTVQRVPVAEWKRVLLNGEDRLEVYDFSTGLTRTRYLSGKSIGAGVVEVSLVPDE